MKADIAIKDYSRSVDIPTRTLWDLGFWAGMLLLCLFSISFLFQAEFTALPSLYYGLISWGFIAFNHYVFMYFGLSLVRRKRWFIFIIFLCSLYLINTLAILPLDVLVNAFPQYERIKIVNDKFQLASYQDLLSQNSVVWLLTVVFSGNTLTASFELFKNYYESRRRNALLQKENAELELNFLRAQIHPHFLFNTLNNIYGLVMDNEKAAQVVLKLSDLLRFSLYESNGGLIPLKREIEFLINYISLEQIRHGDRVSIQYCFNDISDPEAGIAPLLLINFVENAFKHGINATRHQTWVNISLKQENDTITFAVENSKPIKNKPAEHAEKGLGIENVKRRLALLYTGKHRLLIKDTAEAYALSLVLYTNE